MLKRSRKTLPPGGTPSGGRSAMVLYFTQSRGGTSGLKLEREIYRLLINPDDRPAEVGIPDEFEPFLGKYTASIGVLPDAEYTVLVQDGRLALDIPGTMVFELTEPDDKGIRRFAITTLAGVTFDADSAGRV